MQKLYIGGILLISAIQSFATIFTNNTLIGASNSNYDGTDIVVSNCTLTVNGPHTFASMTVNSGGVLTHSFSASGIVTNLVNVTNESQVLSGTNPVQLLTQDILLGTVSVADATGTNFYTNGQDYLLTVQGALTDLERTTNSAIPDGSTVLVSYEATPGSVAAGLFLTIVSNVEVDAGGAINANAVGLSSGIGSGGGFSAGSPQDGSGGGYGGYGGTSSSNAPGGNSYGSYTSPASLGSAGGISYTGPGGTGGGLIEIAAGGSVLINGAVSANGGNGTNSRSGGGSGGSVWITGATFSGSGTITANGGNGDSPHGGGGGGGRIALQFSTDNFTGAISTYGGTGSTIGGAGTIFTALPGDDGLLLLDNGGQAGTNTPVSISTHTNDLLVQNGAVAVQAAGLWTVGNVTIGSNGSILAGPSTTLIINSSSDVTVEQGGSINGNGEGATGGNGSGSGHSYNDNLYRPCGGGSYGGYGAWGSNTNASSGAPYGNQLSPSGYGSGGGSLLPYSIGGNGGGAIQITCSGVVQVDGTISANGGNGSGSGGGGGSGGTISLSTAILIGGGSITANGGAGVNAIGGGGGGGRVYITSQADLFEGATAAYGGGGANWGGAGTVLVAQTGSDSQLILDNNGRNGTNTTVQTGGSLTDLIIRGGAVGSSASEISFENLYIYSNGWLAPVFANSLPASSVYFQFNGDATVDVGGGVIADLAGNPQGSGEASGRAATVSSTNYCSGASHGGYGGNSFGNYALVSGGYDTLTGPTIPGSGGGTLSTSIGGVGGGAIHLVVNGTLEVDGVVSANAGNASGIAGGGGSGGAIWLQAGTLSGVGTVRANGGNGANGLGGGGGGGMVYASVNNNSFSGSMTAYGGSGANWGGAGTVVVQLSGKNAQLVLDENGNPSGRTPLPSSSLIDVTVRGGATAYAFQTGTTLGNIVIASNATLVGSAGSYTVYSTLACTSLDVQPGGVITEDTNGNPAGAGYGSGKSSGTSPYYACSGGGHGGPGGNGFANAAAEGGSANDTPLSPTSTGSGGGTYTPYSLGGVGGGGLWITASGLLQMDGLITANGGNGSGIGGGGGSGGVIRLTANTLGGVGIVQANGGNGAGSFGGGGGGGCIVLNPTVNQFAGTITAYGGSGFGAGGCGTIYIQTNSQVGTLIVDSGGTPGPATPVPGSSENVILRNAAVGLLAQSSLGNVLVTSNSLLLASNSYYGSSMSVSSLTVQAGGEMSADGFGNYGGGNGNSSGSSPSYACSGAGHGGNGGNSISNLVGGGRSYDTPISPDEAGSVGGSYSPYSVGGYGGGYFAVTSSGLVQIDGIISANGANGTGIGGGGGSGGTIVITGGTLGGAGTIRANGGNGANSIGGGGGGGCILLNPSVNQFTGPVTAYGGTGANPGGAGTVVTETSGQNAQLIIDGGGIPSGGTLLPSSGTLALTLRNGAIGVATTSVSLGNAFIGSNSWIMMSNAGSSSLAFTTATIQAGGGITADSEGGASGTGNGPGRSAGISPNFPCSGAGHGGLGGGASNNLAAGGSAYDSQSSPNSSGSGGGTYSPYSIGGNGGGTIAITMTGVLQVDGVITANGGGGSGIGGGGGSGGIIKISGGTLSGTGVIRVNGGNGANNIGGGGAGGCISVTSANSFAGTISAYGGAGANPGGAGTVYLVPSGQVGQLIIDNGGLPDGSTPIQAVSSAASVILRNGASGFLSSPPEVFGSFLIASNSWLTPNPTLSLGTTANVVNLTVSGNLTVQEGGGIIVDDYGYAAAGGTGAGYGSGGGSPYYATGGGGYGGNGGDGNVFPSIGGPAYSSIITPTALGSGGGQVLAYSFGGAGGGAIQLTIGGTLDVSGEISADGGNGYGLGGGGGSGGSVYLTVNTLTGGGSISANGGDGVSGIGGGGGGGRISINSTFDSFAGPITAQGGSGYYYGGAGTIYTVTNSKTGQVLVDNGGFFGTNTPFSPAFGLPATPVNLTIQNGGVVYPQTNFLELSGLDVETNGVLTEFYRLQPFNLLVLNNAVVAPGGLITADGDGSPQGTSGSSAGGVGSGGGYGGQGGASSAAPGGIAFGSALQPTALGGGGGFGGGVAFGGSGGGGAISFIVDGSLTMNGQITANGQAGLQDNSGGGAGGSIWVQAGMLAGKGQFTANGGAGNLPDGGGGAGGRIALDARTNIFFGSAEALGAPGFAAGGNGTVVTTNIPLLQVLSNSPNGVVNNSVSSVTLYFNIAPNPASVTTSSVTLTTPNGILSPASMAITESNSQTYVLSFPAQTAIGAYIVSVNSGVLDVFGRGLTPSYAGTFTVSLPSVQGTVTDTNSNPVPGVLLTATGGMSPATTGTNGAYALGFVPGASFTVTPSSGILIFLPSSMSYTNVASSVVNQNYLAVTTLAASLSSQMSAGNLKLGWLALPGINYQIYSSTNLINWIPYGGLITNSNGPVQISLPINGGTAQYFQVEASH